MFFFEKYEEEDNQQIKWKNNNSVRRVGVIYRKQGEGKATFSFFFVFFCFSLFLLGAANNWQSSE